MKFSNQFSVHRNITANKYGKR